MYLLAYSLLFVHQLCFVGKDLYSGVGTNFVLGGAKVYLGGVDQNIK